MSFDTAQAVTVQEINSDGVDLDSFNVAAASTEFKVSLDAGVVELVIKTGATASTPTLKAPTTEKYKDVFALADKAFAQIPTTSEFALLLTSAHAYQDNFAYFTLDDNTNVELRATKYSS